MGLTANLPVDHGFHRKSCGWGVGQENLRFRWHLAVSFPVSGLADRKYCGPVVSMVIVLDTFRPP
jgi:hypothetical protein